jgi:hypothetical protein
MTINLIDINIDEDNIELLLEKEEKDKKQFKVVFSFEWEHSDEFYLKEFIGIEKDKLEQANTILSGISFFDGWTMTNNEVQKEMLASFIAHIPNRETYRLLESCLNAWRELKNCPIHIQEISHPKYPVMSIMYNKTEFPEIRELVSTILLAIANSEVTEIKAEKEEEKDVEEADLLNDVSAEIIEHEVSPEVAALMKNPDKGMESYKEETITFEENQGEEE